MPRRIRIGVIFGGRSGEHDVSLAFSRGHHERGRSGPIRGGADRYRARWSLDHRWGPAASLGRRLASAAGAARSSGSYDDSYVTQREENVTLDVGSSVLGSRCGRPLSGAARSVGRGWHGAGHAGVGQRAVRWRRACSPRPLAWTRSRRSSSSSAPDCLMRRGPGYCAVIGNAIRTRLLERVEREIGYPCFVKPANLGSSVGISKVHHAGEFADAFNEAAHHDRKTRDREGPRCQRRLEVSVLGNDDPVTSVVGEIIPANEFYDFDAKYVDGDLSTAHSRPDYSQSNRTRCAMSQRVHSSSSMRPAWRASISFWSGPPASLPERAEHDSWLHAGQHVPASLGSQRVAVP